jgi:ATP-dependent exoDNAse (exonuclease V) beta subunit
MFQSPSWRLTLIADRTERHLLYVACTRARDHLLVTAVDPASEFLDDLTG